MRCEQVRLKDELRNRLGDDNFFNYRAALVGASSPMTDISTDHLGQLCADVERRLTEVVKRQIAQYWSETPEKSAERSIRELELEHNEHERFGLERGDRETFVGRISELKAILDYVHQDSQWPLVVHGASGCGKTALMARAVQELADSFHPIFRFVGVTPRSSDLRSLISSLCQELRLRTHRAKELPLDVIVLAAELRGHLRAATAKRPVVLFLDGLDKLSGADNNRNLDWLLKEKLPSHVKVVVSCLSDRAEGDPEGQPFAEFRRRQLADSNFINVDSLSQPESVTLLFGRWLTQSGRDVNDIQRQRIEERLESPECRKPIYLKLLFEEARVWRSYDPAPTLGDTEYTLLSQLFERLSRPENHGALLVEYLLGYLAASRHGLAETEILEILYADPEFKAMLDRTAEQNRHDLPANATRIPVAIWSRLRFDLAPYLVERATIGANVLTFYHRQVAEWAESPLSKVPQQNSVLHGRLADYFQGRNGQRDRILTELLWQQSMSMRWEDLCRNIADPSAAAFLYLLIPSDLHHYWTQVESNLKLTLPQIYALALESDKEPADEVGWIVLRILGQALGEHGHLDAAFYIAKRDLAYGRNNSDSQSLCLALCNLGGQFLHRGNLDEAERLLVEALELANPDSNLQTHVLSELAAVHFTRGRYEEAVAFGERAVTILRKDRSTYGLVPVLRTLAMARLHKGRNELNIAQFDMALAEVEEALEITRGEGNPVQIAQALLDLAQVRRHKRQLDEALNPLQEAEDILRPIGKTWDLAQILIEHGAVLGMQGKHEQAIRFYDEAESIYKQLDSVQGLGRCWSSKGMSLCKINSIKEGFDLMRAGDELLAKAGDQNMLTQSMNNRLELGVQVAEASKERGDMYSAFIALSEAVDAAWRLGNRKIGDELAVVASNTTPRLTQELANSGEVEKAIYVWSKNEEICTHIGKLDEQLASLGAQASLMRVQGYPVEKIDIIVGRARAVAQRHPDQKRAAMMMSMMSNENHEIYGNAVRPASPERENLVKHIAAELNRPAHDIQSLLEEAIKLLRTDRPGAIEILERAKLAASRGAPEMLMFVVPLLERAKDPSWKPK